MRRKRLIAPLCLCLLLCGCTADRQIEVQMPAVILGVDELENGLLSLCVKVPLLGGKASGEGEEKGGQEESYALARASGEGWGGALTALHTAMPRDLNFSQLREIVFGERIAQSEKFTEYYQNVCSLPSVRSDAYVVVCKGEAAEFIKNQNARVGSLLSKYIDKSFTRYERMAYVPSTKLGEGLHQFLGSGSDPLFIYGAMGGENVGDVRHPDVTEAVAGELDIKGLSETELFGAAMTDGQSVTGLLTGGESAIWRLVKGTLSEGMSLRAGGTYLFVKSLRAAKLRVQGETLSMDVYAQINYYVGQSFDKREVEQTLKSALHALVQKLQAYGCDAFGFSAVAKRGYLTYGEWQNANFKDVYRTADIEITLKTLFTAQ